MSKSRKVEIILGPPGTGKTTRLLHLLTDYLEKGGTPEQVAFVSFSRRAIKEAVERVGLNADQLPYFRTIHSTAYHLLGLKREDVVQPKHWRQFSELVGLPFTEAGWEDPMWEGTVGDRCLALHNLARARDTTIEHEWRTAMLPDIPLATVTYVVAHYERFKEVNALWDFHDMITDAQGDLPVEVLFVDEAQDTSRAQWSFLRRVGAKVPRVVMSGDDDQTVYAWSGADDTGLRRFTGSTTVLPHSWRLPRMIKDLADGVSSRIQRRAPKDFTPRDTQGTLTWRTDASTVDLRAGSWLLLARSNYQLEQYRELARSQGVVYTLKGGEWSWSLPAVRAAVTYERLRRGHEVPRAEAKNMVTFMAQAPERLAPAVVWTHLFGEAAMDLPWMVGLPGMSPADREYIRALRGGGESLTKPGRVRIGTVHSAKGAESENVVLLTDISRRVAHGARLDPDGELRVQYVGVTRARNALHLILPSTTSYWTF